MVQPVIYNSCVQEANLDGRLCKVNPAALRGVLEEMPWVKRGSADDDGRRWAEEQLIEHEASRIKRPCGPCGGASKYPKMLFVCMSCGSEQCTQHVASNSEIGRKYCSEKAACRAKAKELEDAKKLAATP